MNSNTIKNIKLQYEPLNLEETIQLVYFKDSYSYSLELKSKKEIKVKNLAIIIDFKEEIFKWRNHDYTWSDCNRGRLIANNLSTKCISFKDNTKVIPSLNIGLWEFNPENKKQLIWRLEDKYISPIIQFDKNNSKELIDTFLFKQFLSLKLLFTTEKVPEFSRSKIPFSSILCFTDHCDFDSLLLLEKQRKLFNKLGLKITKGFFLNHFSKRDYNASFEREKEELLSWASDGHELSYHSLTQSIRDQSEAKHEFINFNPPVSGIKTWIDHGFQPYNFTLLNRNNKKIDDWIVKQNERNISYFWTYNDCGSGASGIINQLNSNHFTPKKLLKSLQNKSLVNKISTFIRSYLFYFSKNKKAINKYKSLAGLVKEIIYKKKKSKIWLLIIDSMYLFFYFIKVFFSWKFIKDKPSEFAKYSPILFNNSNFKGSSLFFQTIEINNFVDTFSEKNVEIFINESGICIAHTYFSVLLEYHKGRLFLNKDGDINKHALVAFKTLSNKVKESEIWNPTLADFISHYDKYKNIELGVNLHGEILFLHYNNEVAHRFI